MATIEVTDECLTPDKYTWVKYAGPDPWGVVRKITDSLKPSFHLSSSGRLFDRLNTDVTSDPATFYAEWRARRELSLWTYMWVFIKVQGKVSKATNKGEFWMRMSGELKTSIKTKGIAGFFLHSFWTIYSYLFYDHRRREMLEQCTNMMMQFRNDIKEHYNLGISHRPGGRGAYG